MKIVGLKHSKATSMSLGWINCILMIKLFYFHTKMGDGKNREGCDKRMCAWERERE